MAAQYVMERLAIPQSLEDLHELLERVRAETHLSADDAMMVETAAIEIAGNVVKHGRPRGGVTFLFTLTVHGDRVEAELRELTKSAPVEVHDAAQPDVLAEHGRGLALARASVDELTYEHDGGHNVWRLVRRRG